MSVPRVLLLHATGTNRDYEAACAFEQAGGNPEIIHLNQLRSGERRWQDYQILALPGGFSYADALGAGKLWALDLMAYFADEVSEFVATGKPVIGICNGFQALVKAGILPGSAKPNGDAHQATLTFNASGHFECRWVTLKPISDLCIWTRGLEALLQCPVAHGEGRFVLADPEGHLDLQASRQAALIYTLPGGAAASGRYPSNPNGSPGDLAGVCNPQGNVLGLMPHPEDHIFPHQHPLFTRQEASGNCLTLFQNGIKYAREL